MPAYYVCSLHTAYHESLKYTIVLAVLTWNLQLWSKKNTHTFEHYKKKTKKGGLAFPASLNLIKRPSCPILNATLLESQLSGNYSILVPALIQNNSQI